MLKIEVDKGTAGFDFRIKHRNGNIICFTVQGYKRKSTCKRVLDNLIKDIQNGDYEIEEIK